MGFEQDKAQDEALAAALARKDHKDAHSLVGGTHDKLIGAGEMGDDDEVMKDK